MNFQFISDWLRNTIPGMLLLGACGSILAVFLLKLFKNIFISWLPKSIQAYSEHEYMSGYKHGWTFSFLKNDKNVIGAIAYFTFHGLRMILALFATTFFFQFFLLALPASDRLLTVGTYLLVFMTFICFRWVYVEYRNIRKAYEDQIKPLMDEAIKFKSQKEVKESSEK